MDTVTMVKPRDVVVTKKVLDVYQVPSINLERLPTVEVTEEGNGKVFLNGVLLHGAMLERYEEESSPMRYHPLTYQSPRETKCIVTLLVVNTGFRMPIQVAKLVFTKGLIPESAKLVETKDA